MHKGICRHGEFLHECKPRGTMGGGRSDGGTRGDNFDNEGAKGGKRKGTGRLDWKIRNRIWHHRTSGDLKRPRTRRPSESG
eukprot:6213564-Pleurochrysis_carterae.AAC.2